MAAPAARFRHYLAAPFSSRAPLDPRREPYVASPQAQGILRILESRSTRAAVVEALEAWPCRLTPQVVKEVLHKLKDGSQAATFFDWAANRPGFNHDALTKCELLLALLRTGRHREAYGQAALLGCVPNRFILQGLVSAFAMAGDLRSAMDLLRESRYNRIDLNIKVLNSILRDMIQLGRLDDGILFFDELVRLRYGNVYTVTIVVQGLCDAGRLDKAQALLSKSDSAMVNEFTYRSLVNGLCKAQKMDKAFNVVSWMVDRGLEPGIVAYNMLLHGLCESQRVGEAEELMKVMVDKGYVLDAVSYTVIIDALCKRFDDSAAFSYFNRMVNAGCIPDVVTYTSMVHGLLKVGKRREAMWVLNDMLARGRMPNSVTCNAIIDGLCKVNLVDQALAIKLDMERRGFVPDRLAYNCLIHGYGKLGRTGDAWHVLGEMVRRGIEPCNVTWSSLIIGLSGKGRGYKALKLLEAMKAGGLVPDAVTCSAAVSSLAKAAKLEKAVVIVNEMKQRSGGGDVKCKLSTITYNSLIDGLCRAGKMDDAFEAMDEMRRHGCKPDVISFNTIIGGLVRQRRIDEATMLAKEMGGFEGCSPNLVTRTTIVHGFCSAGRISEAIEAMSGAGSGIMLAAVIAGLVKAGLKLQARAIVEEGLMLVDILVAQGRIGEAEQLMRATQSDGFDGNLATFMTLLHSSCCDEVTIDAALALLWNMQGICGRTPGRLAFDAMSRSLYGVTGVGKARRLLNDARRQLRLISS